MDRRQKKTRESIFAALCTLLSKKHYNQITVAEIIELANIGRATFYAHFETTRSKRLKKNTFSVDFRRIVHPLCSIVHPLYCLEIFNRHNHNHLHHNQNYRYRNRNHNHNHRRQRLQ